MCEKKWSLGLEEREASACSDLAIAKSNVLSNPDTYCQSIINSNTHSDSNTHTQSNTDTNNETRWLLRCEVE